MTGSAEVVRVALPAHLRTLVRVNGEVELRVTGLVTQGSVLDALEARYPMLRGTIRDQRTGNAARSSGSSPASRTCRTSGRTPRCPRPSRSAPNRT